MVKFILENPWAIVAILIWTLPWKGAALWRAARRGHFAWFGVILVLNTLAILEILYIFIFSKRIGKAAETEDTQSENSGSYLFANSNDGKKPTMKIS